MLSSRGIKPESARERAMCVQKASTLTEGREDNLHTDGSIWLSRVLVQGNKERNRANSACRGDRETVEGKGRLKV